MSKKDFEHYEEKQTDVNIALEILDLAYQEAYDTAVLISADTDLIPAIEKTKRIFPDKNFRILIPPGLRYHRELSEVVGGKIKKIKKSNIERSLFKDSIDMSDLATKISNPYKLANDLDA